jgi:hypothetical protein
MFKQLLVIGSSWGKAVIEVKFSSLIQVEFDSDLKDNENIFG